MDSLPQVGFVRLKQVREVIPVSKSTWYLGIKQGIYPAGIKISKTITMWRVEDIRELIKTISEGLDEKSGPDSDSALSSAWPRTPKGGTNGKK